MVSAKYETLTTRYEICRIGIVKYSSVDALRAGGVTTPPIRRKEVKPMHDITEVVYLLSLLAGLATSLVKFIRELSSGRAKRRKQKGRHFRSDGLTL